MKRTMGFKLKKSITRHSIFALIAVWRAGVASYRFLIKLKEDALSDKGMCPECHSMNLEYSKPKMIKEVAEYPYECNDCGTKGKEKYSLHFMFSMLEKGTHVKRQVKRAKKAVKKTTSKV